MSYIPLPAKEEERIAILHSLQLLDTPPEPVFDRITQLAARLLSVPIALISLIDVDRQWFKSCIGIDSSETPREFAFCAYAILATEPMVVTDATRDERFRDNPFVTGPPYVRFYAGAPVLTASGHALGTLCVVDTQPREPTVAELDTLVDLAALASHEIQQYEALALSHGHLHRTTAAIEASDARFRAMFDLAAVGIAFVAPTGNWLQVNKALTKILGYSHQELALLTFQDITYVEDLRKDLQSLQQLVAGDIDQYQMEKRYTRKDGTTIWAELLVTKQIKANGELDYFVAIIEDIQARKDVENSLASLRHDLERRVEERTRDLQNANDKLSHAMSQQARFEQKLLKREVELTAVLENANDAYVCIDHNGLVTAWNRVAQETFGWNFTEAIGQRLDDLIIPHNMRDAHREGMKRYLTTGEARVLDQRLELPAVRKDGSKLPVEIRIRSIEIEGQKIFSAFLHDITDRKKAEAIREQEALHDALTGLPNRRALFEYLPKAIARSSRNGQSTAVLFLDVDGFKAVNDAFGHEVGDSLLKEIAHRLNDSVRQTDAVARLAGDEFTVVLENLTEGIADARLIAEKLLAKLTAPVHIGEHEITIGVSIGIAMHGGDESESADQLLKRADTAMYTAKREGKCRIREI